MSKTDKNMSRQNRQWLIVSCVVLIAIVAAAVVVPNIFRARTSPAMNPCIIMLRQLDGALQQWTLQYQKKPEDKVTMSDLIPYLRHELQCPQGGKYTVGPVLSNGITCSFPGHVLPQ